MIRKTYFSPKSALAASIMLASLACAWTVSPIVEAAENKDPVPVSEPATNLQPMSVEEQIAFSRLDLATRLGIEMDVISVSGSIPVKWRSAALGCPEPGKTYMDTLIPGVLIMLRVGNTAYRYGSLPGREPFYCPADRTESPYVGPEDI